MKGPTSGIQKVLQIQNRKQEPNRLPLERVLKTELLSSTKYQDHIQSDSYQHNSERNRGSDTLRGWPKPGPSSGFDIYMHVQRSLKNISNRSATGRLSGPVSVHLLQMLSTLKVLSLVSYKGQELVIFQMPCLQEVTIHGQSSIRLVINMVVAGDFVLVVYTWFYINVT